jgi:uncharacterized membrane protein
MAENKTEPMDRLREVSQDALKALGDKVMGSVGDRVSGVTDKLEGVAEGNPLGKAAVKGAKAKAEGDNPLLAGVKGAASGLKDKVTGGGGGSKGGGDATKSTNIIESIDVGVPIKVAYNQWTEFGAFPSFMKKVENVEAQEDNKLNFKAQIFLSHRQWEATITEQIPDERIVWRSKGEKGHVDGSVTFHELGPNLTRILVVLEYYPQGLFEKTGNLWRAQGRRARAELRHFRRHVMTRTILDAEEVEGWRGRIEDGEVVETHEDALEREEQEQDDEDQDDGADEEYGDEDEYDEASDEDDEGDPEEADDEAGDEDEADDEVYDEEEAYDEEDAEAEPEEGDEDEAVYDEESEEGEEPEAEDEAEDEYEEPEDEQEEEPEEEPENLDQRRRRRRAS